MEGSNELLEASRYEVRFWSLYSDDNINCQGRMVAVASRGEPWFDLTRSGYGKRNLMTTKTSIVC